MLSTDLSRSSPLGQIRVPVTRGAESIEPCAPLVALDFARGCNVPLSGWCSSPQQARSLLRPFCQLGVATKTSNRRENIHQFLPEIHDEWRGGIQRRCEPYTDAFQVRPMNQADDLLRQLTDELENFEDIAKYLLPQPGEVPRLQGLDVYGSTLALNGVVGGDHLIYV